MGGRIKGNLGWHALLGYNSLAAENLLDDDYFFGELNLQYQILPNDRLTPNINIGAGVFLNTFSSSYDFTANVGLNLEYSLTKNVGLKLGAQYQQFFDDTIDNVENGAYNDYLVKGVLGLNFYF